MIRGIHHTAISCIDIDRSVAFYRDLLGFELVMEYDWSESGTTTSSRQGLRWWCVRCVLTKVDVKHRQTHGFERKQTAMSGP